MASPFAALLAAEHHGIDQDLQVQRALTIATCRAAKPFFTRLFTGLVRRRARILGNEFAGVVAELGSSAKAFLVGENVFGYNEGPFGAHAQYLAIPQDGSLTTMPANLTHVEAAPSAEGSHFALAHIRGTSVTGRMNRDPRPSRKC